ncbi:hypothetical protein PFISCL1PPCAC_10751 [Pristionchus fissidentatus]|uniref:Hydrolase n=1 Tax=Pristionchus fissidentatus TaxID=1538716 RepID=A0AAV5VM30_9BILA|nr:hypothetical protein PFISCL1PPCAC_10751 [Pristionchus fissidentatus]
MTIPRIPPVVQVLSLDAMNTLIKPRIPIASTYARFARSYNVNVDESALTAAFPSLFKSLSECSPCYGFNNGGPLKWWNSLIVHAMEKAGSGSIQPEIASKISTELYDYYTLGDAWQLVDEEIPSVLSRLRLKGIGICVVSNFDTRLKPILTSMGLADHFQMIVLSGELGIEKPDIRVFDTVLRHFSLRDPSTLLHIGDDLEKDYRAAKSMGARALLLDPKNKHVDTVPQHDRLTSFSQLNVY